MGKRVHPEEFKREAVRLASQPGMSKVQAAKDLGLHVNVLRKWIEQFEAGRWEKAPGAALKRAAAGARAASAGIEARDDGARHPKNGGGLLREGTQVKYAFMTRHRTVWPVQAMCRMLGVSRAGLYEWSTRSPSARSVEDARLMVRIRESFTASDGTYGGLRATCGTGASAAASGGARG